jgi:drug/metabolite transporter (DMT)-like permease
VTSFTANIRGALYMTLAMGTGALSDTAVKALAVNMNMGQIMLLRGIAATVLITLLAYHRGALRPLSVVAQPMVVIRSLGEIGATVTFLIALARIPLANASAILQAIPLAVTMGAALFLREPVGWRRWTAIIVGFTGVLIVVRPGLEGFTVDSLLVLATVAFAAVRDLATRKIPPGVPSLFISAITAPAIALTGAVLVVPMGGWQPVATLDVVYLLAAALLLLVNYQFITMAVRVGEISFVAPFRYTNLPLAMVLGLFVFAEVPDVFMIAGAAVIVGSGLYALHRERRLARKLAATIPPVPR